MSVAVIFTTPLRRLCGEKYVRLDRDRRAPTLQSPLRASGYVSSDRLFAAGDARANENVEMTALQTLFVREHNVQADRIAAANPRLTDEQIYQNARSIVIAELQSITYNEWLPSLLGRGAIARYVGYDSSVNPGISNEFATAAFRFGHSLLGDDVEFLDNNGIEVRDGVALSQAFFNPDLVQETGIDSILQITSDNDLQSKLESLYGTVDDIDLWVGGLAEDHVPGSSLGATFQTIIVDQFQRLRDGDRYWYQNQFSGTQLAELQKTSLSDIMERNTSLNSIQQNTFFFKAEISGTINEDLNRDGKISRNEPPMVGAQVQLLNKSDGLVVATTRSDRQGRYSFGVADGLRTGIYQIKVTKADGQSRAASGSISITGGDDFARINVAVPGSAAARPVPPAGAGNKPQPGRSQTLPQARCPESANKPLRSVETPRKTTLPASVVSTTSQGQLRVAPRLTANDLHPLIDSLFATLPPGLL